MDSINPAIATPAEEVRSLLDGFLSPAKLKSISGKEDLNLVTFIEIKADSRLTSLSDIGRSLPLLEQLKLSNSFIPSIRDIGSGYSHLTVLWLARCQLVELDGISSMSCLKELYLAYNEISDLSSLVMMDQLEILDLESNCISETEEVENLALCTSLTSLTLEGNPVTGIEEDEYLSIESSSRRNRFRMMVWDIIPHLVILDDEELDESEREFQHSTTPIATSPKKQHALLPKRPATSMGRSSVNKFMSDMDEDFSSDLTHGTGDIISGNPALFLRSRRKNRSETVSISLISPQQPLPTPQRSAQTDQLKEIIEKPLHIFQDHRKIPSENPEPQSQQINPHTKQHPIQPVLVAAITPSPALLSTIHTHLQPIPPPIKLDPGKIVQGPRRKLVKQPTPDPHLDPILSQQQNQNQNQSGHSNSNSIQDHTSTINSSINNNNNSNNHNKGHTHSHSETHSLIAPGKKNSLPLDSTRGDEVVRVIQPLVSIRPPPPRVGMGFRPVVNRGRRRRDLTAVLQPIENK